MPSPTHIIHVAAAAALCVAAGTAAQAPLGGYTVPDVVGQFSAFNPHGEPIGFRRGIADDALTCKHYQGVQRVHRQATSPFFLVTRSGNKTAACAFEDNDPGELVLAYMPSRGQDGERVRSNRLKIGADFEDTEPPANDKTFDHWHFNGSLPGADNHAWSHPGGFQFLDDVLIVPLEARHSDDMASEEGAVQFLHLDENFNLSVVKEILFEKKVGVLGAVRNTVSGKYLLMLTGGEFDNGNEIEFYETTTTSLTDPNIALVYRGTWFRSVADDTTDSKWRDWQVINAVRQTNKPSASATQDEFFIIGTDNATVGLTEGTDWARLFKVSISGPAITITYQAEKHMKLNSPKMGDFDAAGGTYVSPTGELLLYSITHDNDGPNGSIEMGEFRHRDVRRTSASDGNGWVCLYDDTSGWWTTPPDRSLTLDWQDQGSEEWYDLTKLEGFNDKTSSLRWCLPVGRCLRIYANTSFGGSYLEFAGDGTTHQIDDLANEVSWELSSVQIFNALPGYTFTLTYFQPAGGCSLPGSGSWACPWWGPLAVFYALGSVQCYDSPTLRFTGGALPEFIGTTTYSQPMTLMVEPGTTATLGDG
ncbi:MAG: hypothetical protein JNM94_05175 [Phycisphaerae bacterium]|nr:hypothetical protein [Phycisphaerae bacterium]